ncbi:FKBP-type peptidyl-prolyl cis-trans isomerase [Streptomyces sp. LP05-1]|uniref:peptidylprolyl isomerase n=1 Tax=Streptomyces pyxinae TaxID=2970734 RepID=A0ABT2CHP5_9ACTN|nr:FKBP-type peptidyl-prolyl cis-trans isomerase [Streptomyces sp. LP05-1]MCS0636139.1 FKBP-type peptidyl-prolyl cis-trans isomerase [Streptomyces sp. LP05-1]
MRRRLAALLIVPALLLTACGGEDSDAKKDDASSASPDASSPSAAPAPKPVESASPLPTVTGDKGKKPNIAIPQGNPSSAFVVRTISEGDGPAVKAGDLVQADYTVKLWKGGKELGSSYDQGGVPQVIDAGAKGIIPAFAEGVNGKKIGSRVLVVAPPNAAFGAAGQQQLGVKGTDTLVFVLDIKGVMPKKAEGEQADIPANLPQVDASKEEPATIKIPKNDPPAKLVSDVLIEGKGPEVKNGQMVYMQYTGAAWKINEGKAKAEIFDSSWTAGKPFNTAIGQGQVIEGWDKGLVGKKVGSRVLLVIPPAQAYKDQDKGPQLPANSTLVFVVDIIGAM